MKVNYYACRYCANETEEDERTSPIYPCYNPKNFDGDCVLDNKVKGRKAECKLID